MTDAAQHHCTRAWYLRPPVWGVGAVVVAFAVAATRRVKGVQAMADEIEVRYASDSKTADDEITKRAVDILGWDTMVPSGSIQVMVRDGWVTLSGSADWFYQKMVVEEDVRCGGLAV